MWNTYPPHTRKHMHPNTHIHTYIYTNSIKTTDRWGESQCLSPYKAVLCWETLAAGMWMLWDMHQHITDLTYPPVHPTAQQTVVKDGSKSTIKRLISMHKDSRGTLHWPFMVKCGHLKGRSRYAYFQVDCHKRNTVCKCVWKKLTFFVQIT